MDRQPQCPQCHRPFGVGPDKAHCNQAVILDGGPSNGKMGALPYGSRTVCDQCIYSSIRSVYDARQARRESLGCFCSVTGKCQCGRDLACAGCGLEFLDGDAIVTNSFKNETYHRECVAARV